VQQREPGGESRDSFPAIAGHITAYARMELWRIIRLAGEGNAHCESCGMVYQFKLPQSANAGSSQPANDSSREEHQ